MDLENEDVCACGKAGQQATLFDVDVKVRGNDEDLEEQIRQLVLTTLERRIVDGYRAGKRIIQIADESDITREAVSEVLVDVRNRCGLTRVELLRTQTAMSERVTAAALMRLIRDQQFKCAITGRLLTPETTALDHKVPRAKGGRHVLSNVWLVCREVNVAKGTMGMEEFVAMCSDVVTVHATPPPG